MNSPFYIGLAVGFLPWLLLLLVFRLVKTPKDGGPTPTSLLAERNEIGQAQTDALAEIACMVKKLAQFDGLKIARHKEERRERIAVAIAGQIICHNATLGIEKIGITSARSCIAFADLLGTELDRKEVRR